MKKEDWPRTHVFASQDLRTGEVKWIPIFYPPIFKEEYDNIAGGYGFSVSIRPRACFFPLFSFLPLWLHYNLNPLCVQY